MLVPRESGETTQPHFSNVCIRESKVCVRCEREEEEEGVEEGSLNQKWGRRRRKGRRGGVPSSLTIPTPPVVEYGPKRTLPPPYPLFHNR